MIFLVRWKNGNTDIICARSELDLVSILDYAGKPDEAAWKDVKDLHIDRLWLSVEVNPKARYGISLSDAQGAYMGRALSDLCEGVFPKTYDLLTSADSPYDLTTNRPPEGELLAAAREDTAQWPPPRWHTQANRGIQVTAGVPHYVGRKKAPPAA